MRRLSALFLFVALTRSAVAAPPERTHDITPADYASVNLISEIAVSPDGKQVAYCLGVWDAKLDARASELWVVDTDGKGKPKRLTEDNQTYRHLKWSADGKAIFALANRRKTGEKGPPQSTQVWKVALEGGDPTAITKLKGGVESFDYAPKADAVFYAIDATTEDADDFSALRKKFPKPEYSSGKRKVSEVFSLDLKDEKAKPEKVIAEKRYIREFAVTQDGKRIAMISAFDDSVVKSEGESRVDVWQSEPGAPASGGKVVTPPTDVYRAKAATTHAWLESLAWNPDGSRFAFCAIFDGYPTEVIIGELGGGKWETKRLSRKPNHPKDLEQQVRGYGSPLKWIDNMQVAWMTDRQGNVDLRITHLERGIVSTSLAGMYLGRDNEAVQYGDPELGGAYSGFDYATGSEEPVQVHGWAREFPVMELTTILPNGKTKVNILVDPNPHTKTWKLPAVYSAVWTAPDGSSVGGPLELPYGWKKGDKPLPLVVAIHGGPTTASYNDLRFDPHNGRLYFAAKGYAVLCPNYRGSTGYGDKFVTDLIGNENDIEVKDIIAGIQHLIKEGIADPDRIAVMGWSNGGYLTNCLITMKDPPVKIRAASSGGSIVDTISEWGFNDEPAYPLAFKKGLPWETPDIYKKTSPTYGLGNVKTPTLIHVGGEDPRCPPGHSRMLYRALSEYVKVPTELVVYPGEPHGLTKLSNRVAKMEWDLAWFEKYLKK
jgi:dipeptidyl aminopeptidase/acylaminoacyl peptidase